MNPTSVQRAASAQDVITSPSLPRVMATPTTSTIPPVTPTLSGVVVSVGVGAPLSSEFSHGRPSPSPSCPPVPSAQQHVANQSQPGLWESVQKGLAERQKTTADYFQNMVRSRSEQRIQAHQQAALPPQFTHQSMSAHQLSSHRNSISSQGSDSSLNLPKDQQRPKSELLNSSQFPLFPRQSSKSVMAQSPRFVGQNNAAAQEARRAAARENTNKKFFDGFEMPSFGFKSKSKSRQSAQVDKMKVSVVRCFIR